jgi:hypothetical protein
MHTGLWQNLLIGSRENTGLLISFGGGAAVAKVRTKWPDNDDIQRSVRSLADLIVSEMKLGPMKGKREGNESSKREGYVLCFKFVNAIGSSYCELSTERIRHSNFGP